MFSSRKQARLARIIWFYDTQKNDVSFLNIELLFKSANRLFQCHQSTSKLEKTKQNKQTDRCRDSGNFYE